MPFTESDIKNYRCHANAVIAEIYPLSVSYTHLTLPTTSRV